MTAHEKPAFGSYTSSSTSLYLVWGFGACSLNNSPCFILLLILIIYFRFTGEGGSIEHWRDGQLIEKWVDHAIGTYSYDTPEFIEYV